ncbi:MAG: hypothetical protein KTR32_16180, partial [Granulosicoccus sp.]|nr:hypothetical protein [Granulosicoccus sp.]
NKTKHNRESEFRHASLGNALSAVAACACIFEAQIDGTNGSMYGYSMNVFRRLAGPTIESSEQYQMPNDPDPWAPVDYPL